MSRPETSPNVPRDRPLESRVCVLVACFAGTKRAGKVRGQIGKSIKAVGGTVIDEAILTVKADRKTLVYDPRRTVAGTLTPALTWGVFGLIAGGLQGLWVWGIIGAICGGVNAYLTEHLATKDELKQIGDRLPSDSSAIAVFVQGADPQRMLSSVAPVQAVTSSIAAIASGLLRRRLRGRRAPDRDLPHDGFAARGEPEHLAEHVAGALPRRARGQGARRIDQRQTPGSARAAGGTLGRSQQGGPPPGRRPDDGQCRVFEGSARRLGRVRSGVGCDRWLRRRRGCPRSDQETRCSSVSRGRSSA